MGRKAVARKYLQGWFTLDVVSSFPIDLVLFGKRSDLWRLPRLLKVTSCHLQASLHRCAVTMLGIPGMILTSCGSMLSLPVRFTCTP